MMPPGPFSLFVFLLADLQEDKPRDDEHHKADPDNHLSVHACRPPFSF